MNNNMKQAREAADMSQKQVALTLRVSAPTVSDWEAGKMNPSAENLKKLSNLYKVSTDYLLGLTNISVPCDANDSKMVTTNPVFALVAQYHVETDVLAALISVNRKKAEEWIQGTTSPTAKEYELISEIFKIPSEELSRGILPLFPDPDIQLTVRTAKDIRFAASGKLGEEFTKPEMDSILSFIDFVRSQRKEREE